MTGMEHAIERPPIVELAESFKGDGPVYDATILLMRAWGESDPRSGVSQHPASYVATFVDMARALHASGLLAPAPLREEWGYLIGTTGYLSVSREAAEDAVARTRRDPRRRDGNPRLARILMSDLIEYEANDE